MLRLIPAVVVAALLACAHTIPAANRTFRHDAQAAIIGYANGLRVLVAPDLRSNLVEVDLRIWAGGADDPVGSEGLAHLVEHVAFEQRHAGRSIAATLAELTLNYNATTEPDVTHYTALVLADDVAAVLGLYSHLLRGDCTTIPDDAFAREQSVVANELRLRNDLHSRHERDSLLAAIFPVGHPYGQSVGGSPDRIKHITREHVCRYFAEHYDPARAAIVVTGAVTFNQIKSISDATLRPLGSRSPAPRPPIPPFVGGARGAPWSKPSHGVALAFPLPERFSIQAGAVELFAVTGSSVLADYIEDDARFTGSSVEIVGGRDTRALAFIVEYDDTMARFAALEAIKGVVEEIPDIASNEIIAQSVRQRLRRGILERIEPLKRRSYEFADYLRAPIEYGAFQGDLNGLDRLEATRIRSLARTIFAVQNAAVVDLVPNPQADATPSTSALATESGYTHLRPTEPSLVDPRALLDRPGVAVPVHKRVLSNGLRVIMVPSSLLPVIDIRLVIPAGHRDAPGEASLTAAFAALAGTPRLAERRDRDRGRAFLAGVDLVPRIDEDQTIFAVRALTIYSDLAVAVLRDAITHQKYTAKIVAEFRKAITKELKKQRPIDQAWATTIEGLVGTCPDTTLDVNAALASVNLRQLSLFRRRYHVPQGSTVLVTGNFDPTLVLRQIEVAFAGWRGAPSPHGSPRKRPTLSPTAAAQTVVSPSSELRQVYLRLGVAVPAGPDTDAVSLAILRELVAMELRGLRERLGSSYAPNVALARICGADVLVIHGDAEPERSVEFSQELAQALVALRSGHNLLNKLSRARQSVIRELIAEAGDSRAVGDRLEQQLRRGSDRDERRTMAERAASLPLEVVARSLQNTFIPAHAALLCSGGSRAAKAACSAFASTLESNP